MGLVLPSFTAAVGIALLALSVAHGDLMTLPPKPPATGVPIVFIHGFKGAHLVEPSGRRVWLTLTEALGIWAPKLALPLRWDGDTQARDGLCAAEPLRGLTVIPWLLEEKIYGDFIDAATATGRPFSAFAYDWRRDNLETEAAFEAYLERLRARAGQPAQVVAHSMGGLITAALARRRPELFQSIVFAGVPFGGAMGVLPDVHEGSPVGFGARVLAADVMFSFASIYSLLPEAGHARFVDERGATIDANLYDAADWVRLGLSRAAAYPEFLARALARGERFRSRVVAPPRGALPPTIALLSGAHPTVSRARRVGGSWAFEGDDAGDGLVRELDALPPGDFKAQVVRTPLAHRRLLDDPRLIDRLRELAQARK